MSDFIDVIYRLRDMSSVAADSLRREIAEAQKVLDRLDRFADEAESSGELVAASDLFPDSWAAIPDKSGLVRKEDV